MFRPAIAELPPGTIPKKRGAPSGHKGATRVLDRPDKIIHVSTDECPECHHKLGSPIRTERRTILDIPPPQRIRVTEYDVDIYRCGNCGSEVRSKLCSEFRTNAG